MLEELGKGLMPEPLALDRAARRRRRGPRRQRGAARGGAAAADRRRPAAGAGLPGAPEPLRPHPCGDARGAGRRRLAADRREGDGVGWPYRRSPHRQRAHRRRRARSRRGDALSRRRAGTRASRSRGSGRSTAAVPHSSVCRARRPPRRTCSARSAAAARCWTDVVDRATAGLCAEMLGSMEATFEMTLDYLKTRQQFGVPIGSFQALKHRAAVMFTELELARSAALAAAMAIDEASPRAARVRLGRQSALLRRVHADRQRGCADARRHRHDRRARHRLLPQARARGRDYVRRRGASPQSLRDKPGILIQPPPAHPFSPRRHRGRGDDVLCVYRRSCRDTLSLRASLRSTEISAPPCLRGEKGAGGGTA